MGPFADRRDIRPRRTPHRSKPTTAIGSHSLPTNTLDIVEKALRAKRPTGGPIVVGHSLGTIVAYDALTRLRPDYDVRLFCTAGSPLGYPVVQKDLLSKVDGQRPRVPGCVPARADGWVNAFDVNDVVALIHPLRPDFTAATPGQVRDERTFNGDQPHSISDYMADPDIAGPIGRALAA
jgi:pimeloyl-ACP methyl ester carboxylesterase